MAKKIGRKRGRRTKGYFYRTGRGWYSKDRGRFILLCFEDGLHIKENDIDEGVAQKAYSRFLLSKQKKPEKQIDLNQPDTNWLFKGRLNRRAVSSVT